MMKINKLHWLISLFLIGIGLVLGGCSPVEEPGVYRIGVLSGLNFIADITDGFKAGMADLGYIEGENIVYDVQKTDFDMVTYQKILQKFIADEVDLIFVFPTEASLEAKAAIAGTDIPVVFDFALVEEMGLIDSVREPGGNLTGVRFPGPYIALKRFEIMREISPGISRMLVPYQRGYPIVKPQLEALYPVAEEAGVTLIEVPADDAADLQAQLEALAASGETGEAVLILAEPLGVTPPAFAVLGAFSAEHNMPIGGALMAVDGYESIFGLNVDTVSSGKQAAVLADKVLKGEPAGTIPVISAEGFLQINYRAAQDLGLNVPDGLLHLADEIIR